MTGTKDDVGGMALAGEDKLWQKKRADRIALPSFELHDTPAIFWDFFGELGHPVTATIAEIGPVLLSRILDITEAQEGVINIAFRIAGDDDLPLLDPKDLRAILAFLDKNQRDISAAYGNVTTASIGAIQRKLMVLENPGATSFFLSQL